MLLTLVFLLVLAAGVYWMLRRKPDVGSGPPAGGLAWLPKADQELMSAMHMKQTTLQLLSSEANWVQILGALNPRGDPMIQQELVAIRGPHMFAPATALRVIQEGCDQALRDNERAPAIAALAAARKSMERVTRYSD